MLKLHHIKKCGAHYIHTSLGECYSIVICCPWSILCFLPLKILLGISFKPKVIISEKLDINSTWIHNKEIFIELNFCNEKLWSFYLLQYTNNFLYWNRFFHSGFKVLCDVHSLRYLPLWKCNEKLLYPTGKCTIK